MTAPLRRVAVRGLPQHADPVADAGWHRTPDRDLAATQHAAFVAALEASGAEVEVLLPTEGLADSCFVYDPVFVTGRGMVVLRQAKPVRSAEPPLLATELAALGVPRWAGSPATRAPTAVTSAGSTSARWPSAAATAPTPPPTPSCAALLAEEGVEVLSFDLPHDRGPGEVLHLMSLVSPVAERLAVVYEPLAPVALLEALTERGIRWVAVSGEEYAALGSNVLATGPGKVVMFDGAPNVARRAARRGCRGHRRWTARSSPSATAAPPASPARSCAPEVRGEPLRGVVLEHPPG